MHVLFKTLVVLVYLCIVKAEISDVDLNDLSEQQNAVKINKCCEPNELMVDSVCRLAEQYNQSMYLTNLTITITTN